MATYNGKKYIRQQLESILLQLSESDEVIVSDDSSTDNTLEIIESFKDKRIKIFRGNSFKNPIFNFEFALKQAKGDFIFLSDQDDFWLENKVEVTMKYLKYYDMIVSDCYVTDELLQIQQNSFFELKNSKPGFFYNFYRNTYSGNCMAFRKSVLNKALPFPKSIPMHDIWLGAVCDLLFKVKFIEEKLIYFRRHGENSSSSSEKSKYNFFNKLMFRVNIILAIPKIILR